TGDQLWSTDGTTAGTTALTRFSGVSIPMVQNVGGTLYFDAYDSNSSEVQVWTSDGTAGGTAAVPATGGTYNFAGDFTAVGNTVFFVNVTGSPPDGTTTAQLWAIKGGSAAPVTPDTVWFGMPTDLTALNDSTLLFAGDDGSGHGEELWKSDGTAAGTKMVADVNPGPAGALFDESAQANPSAAVGEPGAFTVAGGVAYFSADNGSAGQELWKSDGTASGTVLVKNIASGSANSSPQSLTDVNGAVYFVAHDGSDANQLWKTDGTSGGTSLVQSFTPAQTQSSS